MEREREREREEGRRARRAPWVSQWANTQRERERASGAPSGVVGDSLLPSENHEAIPCIERPCTEGRRRVVVGETGSARDPLVGSQREGTREAKGRGE